MGPVRGYKRRKKNEENDYSPGSSLDWWDVFSKKSPGLLLPSKGLDSFKSMFKISSTTFDYICSLVKDDMIGKPPNFMFSNGKPMSLHDRVAIALRRLGSGDPLISVADMFGTHHSTVSQVTWRFVEIIEESGIHHLQWPFNEQEMEKIKLKFEKIRGLPNCCGAIGTTHISLLLPSSEVGVDMWLDREKKHSMVLQAIVDPDMRFLHVVTGFPGKMNDFSVLKSSDFFDLCEKGERLNDHTMEISEGNKIREYIVGDSSFPLLPWLVTPYQRVVFRKSESPYQAKVFTKSENEFNKRHFETRQVAHKAFARLKKGWKIIEGVMWRPDKHKLPRIILACCILHNIVIDLEDDMADDSEWGQNHDTGYKQETCDFTGNEGLALRDKLSRYLSPREMR